MPFRWNIFAARLDLVSQAAMVFKLRIYFILYLYRYRLVLLKFLELISFYFQNVIWTH